MLDVNGAQCGACEKESADRGDGGGRGGGGSETFCVSWSCIGAGSCDAIKVDGSSDTPPTTLTTTTAASTHRARWKKERNFVYAPALVCACACMCWAAWLRKGCEAGRVNGAASSRLLETGHPSMAVTVRSTKSTLSAAHRALAKLLSTKMTRNLSS